MSTYDGPKKQRVTVKVETETVPQFYTGVVLDSGELGIWLQVREYRAVGAGRLEQATVVYAFPWSRIMYVEQVRFDDDNVS